MDHTLVLNASYEPLRVVSWQKAITQLLKMNVRAEQQSLARWGLNYVIDEYLPAKLKQTDRFLP